MTATPSLFDGVRAAVFDLDDTLYAFERPGGPNDAALRALAEYAAPKLGIAPQHGQQDAEAGRDPDEPVVRQNEGIVDVGDDIAPGSKGKLDAQSEKAQSGLDKDRAANAHRAADDQLRDHIRHQMPEDAP